MGGIYIIKKECKAWALNITALVNKLAKKLEIFYSPILLITSANAGLVTKTPIEMPSKVVIANPFSKPAPAHHKGKREATTVE
jgi:hypothetical protein